MCLAGLIDHVVGEGSVQTLGQVGFRSSTGTPRLTGRHEQAASRPASSPPKATRSVAWRTTGAQVYTSAMFRSWPAGLGPRPRPSAS